MSGTAEPAVTGPDTSEVTTSEPAAAEPPTTDAVSTDPPTTEVGDDEIELDAWTSVDPGADCMCMDGSPFELWDRPADPTKVVLYFEGGGACFSAETCNFADSTATVNLELGTPPSGRGGLFDQRQFELLNIAEVDGAVVAGETFDAFGGKPAVSHQALEADQERVAGKGGERGVGRAAVAGGAERKNLPEALLGGVEEVRKGEGGGAEVTETSLVGALQPVLAARTDKTVVMRADQSIAYGLPVRVMALLRQAGAERVAIATGSN